MREGYHTSLALPDAYVCPKCGSRLELSQEDEGGRKCTGCNLELPPYPLEWVKADQFTPAPPETQALAVSLAGRVGIQKASTALGLSFSTLQQWCNPEKAHRARQERDRRREEREVAALETDQLEETRAWKVWAEGLLEKFPVYDPSWGWEARLHWLKDFRALVRAFSDKGLEPPVAHDQPQG